MKLFLSKVFRQNKRTQAGPSLGSKRAAAPLFRPIRSTLLALFALLSPLSPDLQAGISETIAGFFPSSKPKMDFYESTETVKVLLSHKVDGAMLQVYGRFDVRDPKNAAHLSGGHVGKQSMVLPMQKGVMWGEQFPDTYQFALIPRSREHTFILDGVQHEGILYVYQIEGKLSLVNELPLEAYVRSVVSTQAEPTLHSEALAALAVCVRTHALHERATRSDGYWHLQAQDVGFIGMAGASRNSSAQMATSTTDGMILRDPGYPEKEGLFPASWIGKCRAAREGSLQEQSIKAQVVKEVVPAPKARKGKEQTWKKELTQKEIVSRFYPSDEEVKVTNITLKRDPSTKSVVALTLEFDHKPQQILSVLRFSQLFSGITSRSFDVTESGRGFLFQGVGEGAGEGLCLFSADKLAQSGKEAPEILAQFFPGTRMEMAWAIERPKAIPTY